MRNSFSLKLSLVAAGIALLAAAALAAPGVAFSCGGVGLNNRLTKEQN